MDSSPPLMDTVGQGREIENYLSMASSYLPVSINDTSLSPDAGSRRETKAGRLLSSGGDTSLYALSPELQFTGISYICCLAITHIYGVFLKHSAELSSK